MVPAGPATVTSAVLAIALGFGLVPRLVVQPARRFGGQSPAELPLAELLVDSFPEALAEGTPAEMDTTENAFNLGLVSQPTAQLDAKHEGGQLSRMATAELPQATFVVDNATEAAGEGAAAEEAIVENACNYSQATPPMVQLDVEKNTGELSTVVPAELSQGAFVVDSSTEAIAGGATSKIVSAESAAVAEQVVEKKKVAEGKLSLDAAIGDALARMLSGAVVAGLLLGTLFLRWRATRGAGAMPRATAGAAVGRGGNAEQAEEASPMKVSTAILAGSNDAKAVDVRGCATSLGRAVGGC